MPVLHPPSTELVPNGHDDPPNVISAGSLSTGDAITWSLSGSAPNTPHTTPNFHFDLWTANRALGPLVVTGPNWGTAFSQTFTATEPTTFQVELYLGGNTQGQPPATAFGVTVATTPNPNPNCAYGVEAQPGAAAFTILTPVFLEQLLSEYGVPALAQLLVGILFQTVDSSVLCAALPPPVPPVDSLKPGLSPQTALQVVYAMLWPKLCRCVAGTPAPVPPGAPTVVLPPNLPAPIAFPCDNVDPCAALVEIQRQLAALSVAVGQGLDLTTLLQRYSLPFAYIPGATHRGVSVTQSYPVSRLVGVKVSVTGAPGGLARFSGLPEYVADLGWLSLVTADGLIDEIRLTRQEQSWFPRLMPLAVAFGVTVREGVTVDWQELQAEP